MKICISKGLRLDKENYRQAKGNKQAGTLIINPSDFLKLTTYTDDGIDEIMKDSKTLEEYNEFTKAGKSILMPWLDISLDGKKYGGDVVKVGQVIGHEGRHRAAALVKACVSRMPISLRLHLNGIEKRFKPTAEDPWAKNEFTSQDLPSTFYGEFNSSRKVKVNTNTFKAFRQ